jgi:hypothetical protein
MKNADDLVCITLSNNSLGSGWRWKYSDPFLKLKGTCLPSLLFILVLVVLEIEPRASPLLSKHCIL